MSYLDFASAYDLLSPFAAVDGARWESEIGLTEGGRTLALAILRARATGPRHFAW